MPAYNAERFIKESIESVINQTYPHWELIIIDDDSCDNTFKIASTYSIDDSRIKILHNLKNEGVSYSRNKGILSAMGDFIAFLDSDDVWYVDKLMLQNKLIISSPDHPIYFSGYQVINSLSKTTSKIFIPPIKISYNDLLRSNYIGCLTAVINRTVVGNIAFSRIGHEDYLLWLTILRNGAMAISSPKVLAGYRVHSEGISHNKVKAAYWRWLIYYKYQKLGFLKSAKFFIIYFQASLKKQWF